MMTDEMKLIDVTGKAHSISKRSTRLILVAGWIFFVVSFGLHFIFYKIHPSGTDISLGAIKRRFKEAGWPDDEKRPEIEDNEEEESGIERQEGTADVEGNHDDGEDTRIEETFLERFRSCFCMNGYRRAEHIELEVGGVSRYVK